ncbi:hypothetical protein Y032_0006g2807 [Ancylostoma ceylanicum]|uniref:Uncharacterized protein n=1 Tax=Ancylostoma ceylanicum TaxID=53326 RepID=A0A016VNH9_9BILA|nr:hypothetical protein Y032_0006g2807 [Ancylostoma ceylanicum]
MAVAIFIAIPLFLLPAITFGKVEDGNTEKEKYFNPAQELLNGCEGITGTELALCIVDRFAMDLQSKQNKNIERLKHRTKVAHKREEYPVPRFRRPEELKSRRNRPLSTTMEPHISLTKFVPRMKAHRERMRRKDGNRKRKRLLLSRNQSRQRHLRASHLTLDHLLRENFRSSRSRIRRNHSRV